MLSTEGYFVLAIVTVVLVTCCGFVLTFCCCDKSGEKWKVKQEITVTAPVEWVWKEWPENFEMAKIFGIDKNCRPV